MARPNQSKQDPVVAARAIAQAEVARHGPSWPISSQPLRRASATCPMRPS